MARLEGTSGQSSSSLPGTHPLLVRSPETPHTPAPTAAAAMRSRGGVPVRHRSYRVGNPQTLVHFIDNSGRTSRLGHTAPTSLLNRYNTIIIFELLQVVDWLQLEAVVTVFSVRRSRTPSTSVVRIRKETLDSTSSPMTTDVNKRDRMLPACSRTFFTCVLPLLSLTPFRSTLTTT